MNTDDGQQPGSRDERSRVDPTASARLGRSAGRLARKAKKAARAAEPEARRLARAAGEATKPVVEKATEFVRSHEDELKRAGRTGANAAVSRSVPPALKPLAAGLLEELTPTAPDAGGDDDQSPPASTGSDLTLEEDTSASPE